MEIISAAPLMAALKEPTANSHIVMTAAPRPKARCRPDIALTRSYPPDRKWTIKYETFQFKCEKWILPITPWFFGRKAAPQQRAVRPNPLA
jgi:hypothetical protein